MSDASPLRILSFESRRSSEMKNLIERGGAQAIVAPTIREVPLTDHTAARNFAERLFAGQIDLMVFLTGVGARALLEAIEVAHPREQLFASLNQITVAVRGPKPAVVLREWGVRFAIQAPEPNTWRELLSAIDTGFTLNGRRVGVQEYGRPNQDFYRALESRGASAFPVPVYEWQLPDDVEPIKAAIHSAIAGEIDVVMFTSAYQIETTFEMAALLGVTDAWKSTLARVVLASIGPTTSETLVSLGLAADIQASPPKMGVLVREVLNGSRAILYSKSAG